MCTQFNIFLALPPVSPRNDDILNMDRHKIQPRTQGLTYGKDPGWGWSRDFTKIDWLRGEGRVSNCMLPQKTLHFNYKEWIRVI